MKKQNLYIKSLLSFLLLLVLINTHAQTGLNFQGVARTSNNVILASQQISLRLSIIQGSAIGASEYTETRKVNTNAQGLFNAVIGDTGAISSIGNFASINWKLSPKFLKIEMDPAAGTNFITMGTTQFQSVAYAMFANSVDAENISGIVPVARGGTGATSLALLPISTATQTALDLKLNIADSVTGYITPTQLASKTFDTTSLSNRIDVIAAATDINSTIATKLNIADSVTGYITPTQLASKTFDTTSLSNRIDIKLSKVDTSTLSNRINSTIATKLNIADSVTGYITPTQLASKTFDTTSLSNRIDIKLSKVDTSTLSNRINLKLNKADTATLSNRIDLKANIDSVNFAKDITVNGIDIGIGGGKLSSNTRIGVTALKQNTIGTNNTAIGLASLFSNTKGSNNTAIGHSSDVFYDSLTNATAIGNGAIVSASNSIQLGNTSVRNVKTNGTLTAGTVTYPNRDSTAGLVLKTDGLGNLSWTTFSTTAGFMSASEETISGRKIFNSDDGFVATGTFGQGNPTSLGAGVRMMWTPRKAAFRVGGMDDTKWDDSTSMGSYSTSFGQNNLASGDYSFVAGATDTASALAAVSFGQNSVASQSHAFAMGYGAKANGYASTSIGHLTLADATSSIAMGYLDTASAFGSVALGQGSRAEQPTSFAMGQYAKARGSSSVAMGENTIASGPHSVAFGLNTLASGNESFAIGEGTIASSSTSTAMGLNTTASGYQSTAMGQGTLASGGTSTAMGLNTVASGYQSTSMGDSTTSSGYGSTSMGNSTLASGTHSVAMGFRTTASGDQSTAMGQGTIASNSHSTAMGLNTTASGYESTAMGQGTIASSNHSTAMGLNTIASGYQSIAMGQGTTASSSTSTAMGLNTTASGYQSTSMGDSTISSGYGSTTMGNRTNASGDHSVAMGFKSVASGTQSIAGGYESKASGNHSLAMGYQSIASNDQAFAFGNTDTASGYQSIAMGLNSSATSNSTVAIGNNVNAASYGETALGIFNTRYTPTAATSFDSTDRLFVIGNGLDDTHRSDAITILKNGNTTIAGKITTGAMTYPNTDSTAGLVLTTDGLGKASWASTPSYTVGLNASLGGYVFYVTPNGKHGLVTETQDQSAASTWYDAIDSVSNPDNHSINGKNFTDWRLPTKYELYLMNLSYSSIDSAGTTFAMQYWSSIEYQTNPTRAWYQFIGSGGTPYDAEKTRGYKVRAVRSF
jgi:hypothetical protein